MLLFLSILGVLLSVILTTGLSRMCSVRAFIAGRGGSAVFRQAEIQAVGSIRIDGHLRSNNNRNTICRTQMIEIHLCFGLRTKNGVKVSNMLC